MKPYLILDLALLALLIVVALGYAHKGFLAGLLQFVGNLASLVGSVLLAQWAAPRVFEKFLSAGYTARVEEALRQGSGVDLEALAEEYAGFLPESFRQQLIESAQGLTQSAAPDLAGRIVTQVLEPLTTPMLSLVLFFVCFALLRLVLGFLVALLKGANHLPVVGGVNRSMGFCLGLLAGLLDVYLAMCILFAVMTITGGQLPYLNGAALEGSWCVKVFGYINPFL